MEARRTCSPGGFGNRKALREGDLSCAEIRASSSHFGIRHMTEHVATVGARRRTDRETVDRLVACLRADVVIVSGGAKAPDT
jgi:hypothetical protein